tara:strand:+ start:553 stop:1176 length:624 start_codon:yes stop_codon:yes gene_type:complete
MSIGLTKLNHPTLGEIIFHRWRGHVSSHKQDIIEHHLSHQNFKWGFTKSTIVEGTNPKEFEKFDDISILAHPLIVDNKVTSDYFGGLIENIEIEDLINRHHLSGEILRAQVNLFIKRDKIVNPCPHIDVRKVPHFSMLYYVNDADGDTIFYDKSEHNSNEELGEMKEWRRESPERGDILIFDGRIYHSPSCPVESTHRISVNFDMLK